MSRFTLPLLFLCACSGSSVADGGLDAGAPDTSVATDLGVGPPDGGVTDLGGEIDAGHMRPTSAPPYVAGTPITATTDHWTWVDFPGALCQNGSPTGLGVNLHPSSTNVVIYLEGGGACFNDITCATVANPDGYGATNFGTGGGLAIYPMFSRTDSTNPFHDWNFVYVPYCSGDIYAGYNPTDSPIPGKTFVGYANVGEFLDRLVPTFAAASLVVLTGSSAGGFGAAYNWDRAQAAFGSTPVLLLDDSGPIMSSTYMTTCLQDRVMDVWNLDATLPTGCTACRTSGGLSNALHYVATLHSDRRAGLMSGTGDATIRSFFGIGFSSDCDSLGTMSAAQYQAGLLDLRTTMADDENFHSYYVGTPAYATLHTWLNRPAATYTAAGTPPVPLYTWIQAFIDGSAGFVDEGPP